MVAEHNSSFIANSSDSCDSYGNTNCSHLIFGISNTNSNCSSYPNYKTISGSSSNNIHSEV